MSLDAFKVTVDTIMEVQPMVTREYTLTHSIRIPAVDVFSVRIALPPGLTVEQAERRSRRYWVGLHLPVRLRLAHRAEMESLT